MALLKTIQTDTGTGGTTTTALRQGSTGDSVKQLQTALANQGYYTGAIDGSYGPKTLAAVKAYQTANKLTVDGIAGPQTQGSLFAGSTTTAQAGSAQPTGRFSGAIASNVYPTTDPFAGSIATGQVGATPPPALEAIVKPKAVDAGRITDTGTSQSAPLRDANLPQASPTTIPPAPVASKTAGLGGAAKKAKQKTLDAQQQKEQEDIQRIVETTTGTGGGTVPSGTTPTGGGTNEPSYGLPNETISPVEGDKAGTWQEYYKKATETEFNYNPAEDQEYKLAASVVEQQVTDMMVGRGGLYSSVAHSALQSRLMSLQVEYQKIAYEKFVEERDFNMQIAGFLANREDAEWEKNFKLAQFKADQEQRKFDNNIKTQQLRISQANAAANRAAAEARAKQAEAANKLSIMRADLYIKQTQFNDVVTRIQNLGYVDAESASYLAGGAANNIMGLTYENPMVQGFIKGANNYITYETNNVAQAAKVVGDADAYLETLMGIQQESSNPEVDYANAYTAATFKIESNVSKDKSTYADQYANAYAGRSELIAKMGNEYYQKLMNDLAQKAARERE